MKKILLFLLLSTAIFAQQNPTITGTLDIRYNTRIERDGKNPKEGVIDTYSLNINVANSAIFKGTIKYLPYVSYMLSTQKGNVTYDVDCFVVNPANISQTRNIGKLIGIVPISDKNQYCFTDGNLKFGTFSGAEGKFDGIANGKPPESSGLFNKLKKEVMSIKKNIGGKIQTISVTNYDKMDFDNHVLGRGPIGIYPDVKIKGEMLYDYDKEAWHFNGLVAEYTISKDGKTQVIRDSITGNIRWIKAANQYDFDIRINEPLGNESTHFGPAAAQDESAFFAVDTTMVGLTGSMRYKDDGSPARTSNITIDLVGNKLGKEQMMYLAKLLFISCPVPLNSD